MDDNSNDRITMARWRKPFLSQSPQSIVLSVPLVIDISSLTLRLFRSTLRRTGLPLPWRIAILALDITLTAGIQYMLQRDKPQKQALPMGSNVAHTIDGKRVRKWSDNRPEGE